MFYYDQVQLPYNVSEQIFAIRERLDNFLAKIFFNKDTSRIIFSDPEYSYRRRIEQLGELDGLSSYDALQLPFLSYYSPAGWEKDTRAGARQLSSTTQKINWGPDNSGIEAQVTHAQRDYECIALFSTMRDAEIAQTLLQWWEDRIVQDEYSLVTSDTKVLFPLSIELTSSILDTGQYLDVWSKSQNMIAVRLNFTIRTPLTKLPPNQPPTYITEEVYWYFHNRAFGAPMEEMTTIPIDQSELFHLIASVEEVPPYIGDSSLTDITATVIPDDSIRFDWEYLGTELPDKIQIYLHLGTTVIDRTITFEAEETVATAATSELFEDLGDGQIVDAVMLVTYGVTINKYHYEIDIPSLPERKKGLAGLRGMSL